MIKKLLASIREYKKTSILTPILMIGEVSMECLIPFLIANLIEEIEHECRISELVRYGLILVGMACASLLFGALAGKTASIASAGFAKNLRHDMYYNIQRFSFANIDKFSYSSLVTRMTTDVSNLQFAYMMIIRTAVRCPMMFVFALIMSVILGGKLALMFVVVVPLLLFGLLMIAKTAMPMFRRVFRKYDRINESIEENVKGMRVVKSFVREEYEKKKFADAAEDVRRDFTRAERIVAVNSPLMQLCLYFNMVFILYIGSSFVIRSREIDLSVADLSSMLTYGFMVMISLMMLSMVYVIITISAESARRIVEVLEEQPSLTNPVNPVMTVKDGSVDFDNVSFRYARKADLFALADVNLHIKSGETVGFIGGTGSSKTTLIQLIPRLYDPSVGVVRVGGVDVRDYDMTALRNQVSVVLQKNELFSGTIKENLRWGNPDATDGELIEACKLAEADEFITSFPDGYDTHIEQGGTNVSGGQKQRICIARALLKRPKVLILDDSTSAVDTKTDALIRRAFRTYIPETTKLIIAQRISSVQDADKIVVMDGGRIVAVGGHDDLMQSCTIYREVYESQNKGGADDE